MTVKKELTNEELLQVAGGQFTEEAEAWLKRNEARLMELAAEKNMTFLAQFGLNNAKSSTTVYGVDDIKAVLANFIDVSELN